MERRADRRVSCLLGVVLTIAACGSTGDGSKSTGSEPADVLGRAIDRTLAASSLRIVAFEVDGEDDGAPTETRFEAPDRSLTITRGREGAELIQIGKTIYSSGVTSDGKYLSSTFPDVPPTALDFPLKHLRGLRDVIITAGGLFRVESKGMIAKVRVADGYVTNIDIALDVEPGKPWAHLRYQLSDFGEQFPPITAPPEDLVTVAKLPPPCREGDSKEWLTLCSGTSEDEDPERLELAPPADPVRSTLQVRPVLREALDCDPHEEANPAARASVRLKRLMALASSSGQRRWRFAPWLQ